MSSSWEHSRKSRRYRPRSTRSVPSQISLHDTIDLPVDELIAEDDDDDDEQQQQQQQQPSNNNDWTAPFPRVKIIPGHIRYPLDQPWMCPPEPQDAPPTPTEMIRIVIVGDAMAGKTTIVQSFVHRQSQTKRSSSVVDYHKKDVTFWKDHSDEIGCARLQLWDVSGLPEPELDTLLAKAHVVMCVISVEHGQSLLMKSIQLWNKRLEPATVRFLLHKSDMLPAVAAIDWIQLGSQIAALMKNDSEYFMTTCASNLDNSVQNAIMKEVRRVVNSRSIPAATIVQTRMSSSTLMEAKAVPMYSLYDS